MAFALAALLCVVSLVSAPPSSAQEGSSVKLQDARHVTVYSQDGVYACFPFLPRRQPGDGIILSIATRTRPSHDDPTGGTAILRSTDGCRTWEVLERYAESFIPEDANAIQALETPDGTLLYVHAGWEYYPQDRREELQQAGWDVSEAGEDTVGALSGHVAMLSQDGGQSWEERVLPMPNAPGVMGFHGGIVTDQGIALWPVYGLAMPGDSGHSYVYRSADNGRTWTFHEIIADCTGRLPMNETSLIDLGDGHILAFVRTGDEVDHLYRAESVNGGITWGRLRDSGITGHPPHLLRLSNGHILLSYGYRHAPFGVRARISRDEGQTWGEEYILRDDGVGGDVGYPMSLELADGTIFTTYYFRVPGGPTHIAGTLWREP